MNKKDYCSYELAKKLKSAGFDEPCDHYYDTNHFAPTTACASGDYNNNLCALCSAPTLWQAQNWLKEKKDIAILLDCEFKDSWGYEIAKFDNQFAVPLCECKYGFQTYESALSAGIKSALILLAGKEDED